MTDVLLPLLLSVFTWAYPQPQHSEGLIVLYGGQSLVEANADWHSYDLSPYADRCGLAAISPAMLGRIAWVRTAGGRWIGPCLAVDVVSRKDAYGSIYLRREVAEVSRATAAALGFSNGGVAGFVWWGQCPPDAEHMTPPEAYAPPMVWDHPPYESTKSFFPYPLQQMPAVDCTPPLPAGHVVMQ